MICSRTLSSDNFIAAPWDRQCPPNKLDVVWAAFYSLCERNGDLGQGRKRTASEGRGDSRGRRVSNSSTTVSALTPSSFDACGRIDNTAPVPYSAWAFHFAVQIYI